MMCELQPTLQVLMMMIMQSNVGINSTLQLQERGRHKKMFFRLSLESSYRIVERWHRPMHTNLLIALINAILFHSSSYTLMKEKVVKYFLF